MMTDVLYPHDAQLYDRRFMNCAERHAVVFLKERRAQTDLLFYRALVSSDEIFRQIIQQKKPKYNFVNGCFNEPDLNALGIYPHELRGDGFAQIKPDVDALIRQYGFVLISGSVFYFPHCPEYRQKHLHHLVVLNGVDEAHGRYQVAMIIRPACCASISMDYRRWRAFLIITATGWRAGLRLIITTATMQHAISIRRCAITSPIIRTASNFYPALRTT
nr:hypothetical protein [Cronobacter dublinensis]